MRERIHSDLTSPAVETYRTARNRVTEYPGTIAAIVIGVGVTAALLWAARRAGGWRNLQDQALDTARQGYDYARDGYDRARGAVKDRLQNAQQEYTR
jgi:putative intracellular protease/amidase